MKDRGCAIDIRFRFSAAPADAFRVTGLNGAQLRLEIAMASTPKKYAVRSIPPRLPGSNWTLISLVFLMKWFGLIRVDLLFHPT